MNTTTGIPLVRLGDTLVSSPQLDLDDGLLDALRRQVLDAIVAEPTRQVIVDVSGVPMVDAHQAARLDQLADMARVMGSSLAIAGIGPGVAMSLTLLGVRFHHATLVRSPDQLLSLSQRKEPT